MNEQTMSPATSWLHRIKHIWHWLTEPNEAIQEVGAQRQARLLSSLLFFLTLLMLQGMIGTLQVQPNLSPVLGVLAILMAATYVLSRTQYYLLAATITVVILASMNFVTNIFQADYSETGFLAEFVWIILPMLVASLYFSRLGLLILWFLNMIGLVVMQFLIPALSWLDLVRTLAFVSFLSLLVIMAAWQRDLIERDRLTQLRDRTDKLRATNRELQDFTYTVSHDLRVPLVNLKGFATELRYSLNGIDPIVKTILPQLQGKQKEHVHLAFHEDIPEALQFIESSVERMDYLVNAVLKLSRVGRHKLHPKLIDMNMVVQQALETLAYQIDEHNIDIRVSPLPPVMADRMAIEQIVGNILSNAVNYLDPTRPGIITITGEDVGRETLYCIQDNGRGIADENMAKVFALFRRAGSEDVPGEGMGLAYVQALVRRHGGKIWCESELGTGTTFIFCIP